MSDTHKIEAIKALYEGQLGTLKILSERSFSTTLQAFTLNIAVVAGLVGGKVMLTTEGKVIGTLLLLVFNSLAVAYLVSKSRAHHRERLKLNKIQSSLWTIGSLEEIEQNNDQSPFWKSFFGGSGIFIFSVVLAGACSIFAMWMSLVMPENLKTANPALKQDAPQAARPLP